MKAAGPMRAPRSPTSATPCSTAMSTGASCGRRPKTEAAFANTWRFLRESPTGPSPRCCAARPRTASVPRRRRRRSSAISPPSRRSPAAATCAAWRRLRREPQRPEEVRQRELAQRHLPQRPTRRNSSTSYGHLLAARTRSPASTADARRRAPVARELRPSCRPTISRSPRRGWRWRRRPPMP